MQPVVRPRAGPRHRHLPVLRYRFRRHGRPGRRPFPTAQALAAEIASYWPAGQAHRLAILTGGEPLLQLDTPLIEALHAERFTIAIETNGTLAPPPGIDWICVSPKAGAPLALTAGDELKLVFPQPAAPPENFRHLAFRHFLLQPMDGPQALRNTQAAVDYCLAHPQWRLSLQTHKVLGLR